MRFGIVGNNDGPLYLLEALRNSSYSPEFVGLQKPVFKNIETSYKKELNEADFFTDFNEDNLLKYLNTYKIDLLINCFCNFRFRKILGLSFAVLNIHLSPLPAYRGRHPLQWALINGEREFGFSIHKMTDTFDAGAIFWQQNVPVENGMSVTQLRNRLMNTLRSDFADFLYKYENNQLQPVANNDEEASYAPRRYPNDSELTEWHDSKAIYRKVQALRSEDYPAFICINNNHIPCLEASMAEIYHQPIERPVILEITENKFKVACLDKQTIWITSPKDVSRLLTLHQKIK